MKEVLCDAMKDYYQYLLGRVDKAEKYFNCLSKDKKANMYESREYKAFENILKELSEIESIMNNYSIFIGAKMTIRKVIALIKRHENVKVIVNSRVKISDDYKRTVHDLKDILINDSDNVEIKLNDRIIEISVKELKFDTGLMATVFYKSNCVIVFTYRD